MINYATSTIVTMARTSVKNPLNGEKSIVDKLHSVNNSVGGKKVASTNHTMLKIASSTTAWVASVVLVLVLVLVVSFIFCSRSGLTQNLGDLI